MDERLIVLAGATGNLGGRLARALRKRGASVRAIVRPGTEAERLTSLQELGVHIIEADLHARAEVVQACRGAECVVSTLLGLDKVLIDAQGALLDAAVEAGVPRFIPSDYAMDFTEIRPGVNRNFDLHRKFRERLDRAPIRYTSVLNGAFMDLLTSEAPLVLFKIHRVLYWGRHPHQTIDFTTIDDTAAYTAEVALDASAPRVLRIAGEQISAEGLVEAVSEVSGKPFHLLRGGSLERLERIIQITRALTPKSEAPFPVWQGMQYLYCMFEGSGMLKALDNQRYPHVTWTGVRSVLKKAF